MLFVVNIPKLTRARTYTPAPIDRVAAVAIKALLNISEKGLLTSSITNDIIPADNAGFIMLSFISKVMP